MVYEGTGRTQLPDLQGDIMQIAIVDDDTGDAKTLLDFIGRYAAATGEKIRAECFGDAILFLTNYRPVYDCVFMDMRMPQYNGMEAAEKLRETDPDVPLVFVTSLTNYAVRGYSVGAVDFIMKPINYGYFSSAMDRVVKLVRGRSEKIFLKTPTEVRNVALSSILYVEVRDHQTTYHTLSGDIPVWGTLAEQEAKLPAESFARCNSCYIVNLRHVDAVKDGMVEMAWGGVRLPVSRSRKKQFTERLLRYCGENA